MRCVEAITIPEAHGDQWVKAMIALSPALAGAGEKRQRSEGLVVAIYMGRGVSGK
jgi:hypothetical protein